MRFNRIEEKRDCYCALCRAPRVLRYGRHLGPLHYLQMALLTTVLTWALFDWLEWKTLGSFFFIWAGYEFTRKLLYRRDLRCQNCGFDPTWYKRDVRIARRRVEEHLQQNPEYAAHRNGRAASREEISR